MRARFSSKPFEGGPLANLTGFGFDQRGAVLEKLPRIEGPTFRTKNLRDASFGVDRVV
jgi:hypothetical protein